MVADPKLSSTQVCSVAEFEGLLATQMVSMRHLALRFTHDSDLANDLVHDTVVRALTYRLRFAQGSNFRAWIRTVLTNTFLHRHRRTKREKEILNSASRFDVLANLRSEDTRRRTREPEKNLTFDSFDDRVEHALAGLPAEFKAVVELCDLEGLSYKEASERLSCPLGTVMSRLHRGRRILKGELYGKAAELGIGQRADQALAPKRPQRAPRRKVMALGSL